MTPIYKQRKPDGQPDFGAGGLSAGYQFIFFAMHGVQSSVMGTEVCYEGSVAGPSHL